MERTLPKYTLLFKFLWIEFGFKSFLELHVQFNRFMCIRMHKQHAECQIPGDAHDWCQTVFSFKLPKFIPKHWTTKQLSHFKLTWAESSQGELIVYQWPVVRPSSSSSTLSNLNISKSQSANLVQILCVASPGWGKGCIRFWGRLDQNSGVHGNRKPPLTYNGENGVSTFSRLPLILFFLCLQVQRTCIKSRTSSNFSQIGPLTTELAALERLKDFP